MRRVTTAITAAALALSIGLSLNAGSAQAVTAGYDSAYQFESAFLTLRPSDSGTFSVFFANTGSASWVAGSSTQVNLAVCSSDKVTCNVPSFNSAWANAWLSATAYATHTKSVVVPGDFSAFTYNVKVPAGTGNGTYRFNGDLVLASTGDRVHPEGYFQDATISGQATGATASPAFGVNSDNPINQEHSITFSGLPAGTMDVSVIASANVAQASDGTYSFTDTDSNKAADGICAGSTFITQLNGVTQTASTTCVNDATVASDGTITVKINTATVNQRVRVVAWQDLNADGQLNLSTAGSSDGNVKGLYSTADGPIAVSGVKYYFPAEAAFGTFACAQAQRHDSQNNRFSTGAPPAGSPDVMFRYDSNDIYRIGSVQVTMAQWKASLTASTTSGSGDQVSVNYNPDSTGFSEFNICTNVGAAGPTNLVATAGNFDGGTAGNDIRLTFTAPSTNSVTSYQVQRQTTAGACPVSPAGTFTTIATLTVAADDPGTYTDFNRPDGTWCYRVRVVDPTTGSESFSNYAAATTPGAADIVSPTSTSSVLTASGSGGFANTLDTGDKLEFTFSETISASANAVIRVTDGDCGSTQGQGGPPPVCSGGLTQTVADIMCGTNATCTVSGSGASTKLLVTMTSNPTIQVVGSTPGAQYSLTVTDASGITDLSGNAWNVSGSADRVIP